MVFNTRYCYLMSRFVCVRRVFSAPSEDIVPNDILLAIMLMERTVRGIVNKIIFEKNSLRTFVWTAED